MNGAPSDQVNNLLATLERFKWARTDGVPGHFDVWQDLETAAEILVPLDITKPHFERLYANAERELTLRYGSDAKHAFELNRIKHAVSLDESQWHKETPYEAGLIRWNEGETLYAAARSMLVAAAKSSREARMYHGNASSYIAKQFLDDSFMGQTSIGSYIITAHTHSQKEFPLSKRSDAGNTIPGLHETVRGGEILATFERSLNLTRQCLDEYRKTPNMNVFLEGVPEGLSYELIKAIGDISRDGEAGIKVVRYNDTTAAPSKQEFEFTPVEAPILDKVATRFSQPPKSEHVTLTGEVVLLSHSSDSDVRVIRLVVDSGSIARKARVRLSAEQYKIALEAHSQDAPLSVSGRLEREGNFYWLYDPAHVHVLSNENNAAVARHSVSSETERLF